MGRVDRTRYLTNEKPSHRTRRIGVVDLETDGLGGRFLIGAWCVEGNDRVWYFDTIGSFFAVLMNRQYRDVDWYAHNGGEYDYKYFVSHLMDMARREDTEIQPVQQGQRCIGFIIRRDKHKYMLRDSFALVPVSLDRFTAAFAPDYRKQDIGLSTGVTFDPANEQHREYLRVDVIGLREALRNFYALVETTFHTAKGWTASSLALHAWKVTIPSGTGWWRPRADVDSAARSAYYGGLVFLRDTERHDDCVTLDVNAMYAHAMRTYGVPTGEVWRTYREETGPGIYHIHYRCPDDIDVPILAVRSARGLVWARGYGDTWSDSDSIAVARSYGYDVKIIQGWVWEQTEYPFNDFLAACEGLEVAHRGEPVAVLAKQMRNSLYGKFGQKRTSERITLGGDGDMRTPVIDPHTGYPIDGLYRDVEPVEQSHMFPQWAAWITAHARIILHEYARAVGLDQIIYADTDSLTIPVERLVKVNTLIGGAYGQLKVDKVWNWFRALGPKNYVGMIDGKIAGKAKGIPRRVWSGEQHIRATETVQRVSFDSTVSTRMVITTGSDFARRVTRAYSTIDHAYGWVRDGDRVRPRLFSVDDYPLT